MTATTTLISGAGRRVPSTVDAGELELWSVGTGPDVVIVEGGGTDARSYRRLVDRLSAYARVHIYDRRGRGTSAPRPADYSLATEVADLASVLSFTGATRVVGHSVGGLFALATAREHTVDRLALFDPAVSVDGSFPFDFLPQLEIAVAAGDPVESLIVTAKGLRNPGSNLPRPLQRVAVRALLRTGPGRTMADLIGATVAESRLAEAEDGPAARWADISTTTRFYVGRRSPGYYLPAVSDLAAAMPDADVEVVPKLGHDAAARAPETLVRSLASFLSD